MTPHPKVQWVVINDTFGGRSFYRSEALARRRAERDAGSCRAVPYIPIAEAKRVVIEIKEAVVAMAKIDPGPADESAIAVLNDVLRGLDALGEAT